MRMETTSAQENRFLCLSCNKSYWSKNGLQVHAKRVHGVLACPRKAVEEKITCLESGCFFRCRTLAHFRKHLSSGHGHSFTEMIRQFENVDHFVVWLRTFEKQNDVEFYRSTMNVNRASKVVYYKCNRSGFYRESKKKVQRRTKVQGSCKIEGYCTAYIKTKEDFTSGALTMSMCNTHYGHALQLEHLRLPKEDKRLIQENLSKGLDLDEVIEEVKKTKPVTAERTNLIKQKDVYNMINKLGINPKERTKTKNVIKEDDDPEEQSVELVEDILTTILCEENVPNDSATVDHLFSSEAVSSQFLAQLEEKRQESIKNLEEAIQHLHHLTDMDALLEVCSHSQNLKLYIEERSMINNSNYFRVVQDSTPSESRIVTQDYIDDCVGGISVNSISANEQNNLLPQISLTMENNNLSKVQEISETDLLPAYVLQAANSDSFVISGTDDAASVIQMPIAAADEHELPLGNMEHRLEQEMLRMQMARTDYHQEHQSSVRMSLGSKHREQRVVRIAVNNSEEELDERGLRFALNSSNSEHEQQEELVRMCSDNDQRNGQELLRITLSDNPESSCYIASENDGECSTILLGQVSNTNQVLEETFTNQTLVSEGFTIKGLIPEGGVTKPHQHLPEGNNIGSNADEPVSRVMDPVYTSFSNDGKTCYIHVDTPLEDSDIRYIIT